MREPRVALGGLATSGMLWVSIGTFSSKLASLGSQLVLGWVLSTQDFALYAIAISWSTIILALRNAGTQRILIQKGNAYDEFAFESIGRNTEALDLYRNITRTYPKFGDAAYRRAQLASPLGAT